jgi:hypothetical protein
VVLDLMIASADHESKEMSDDGHRGGDVGRGAELVGGEVVASPCRARLVHGGDVDAVGQLKSDGEPEPDRPRAPR